MIKFYSSIQTALTVINLLQNEESLRNVDAKIRTWNENINQQGYLLHSTNLEKQVSYVITETEITNDIIVYKIIGKNYLTDDINIISTSLGYTTHFFDRDFDKAVKWLSKEMLKNF